MSQPDNTTPFDASKYATGIQATVPYYDTFHSEIISAIKTLRPNARVWLDTGCGDGALIEKAAAHFPATRFWLADPAASMLDEARTRLRGIPQERLKIAGPLGTEDLPLGGEEQPDVITAVMSHHYFNREQRRNATKRCFDLLANDGIYMTFENIHPDTEYGVAAGLKRWMHFQVDQGRAPEVARQHASRFNTAYFPIKAREHLSLLNDCGFRAAEILWLSYMQAGFYAVK